jgi:hypothetical protein
VEDQDPPQNFHLTEGYAFHLIPEIHQQAFDHQHQQSLPLIPSCSVSQTPDGQFPEFYQQR